MRASGSTSTGTGTSTDTGTSTGTGTDTGTGSTAMTHLLLLLHICRLPPMRILGKLIDLVFSLETTVEIVQSLLDIKFPRAT